jgi:polysaccharide pyruvyl transferase CsaB
MEAMACAKPTIVCGSQGFGGLFTEALAQQAIQSNFCFRGSPLPTSEILVRSIQAVLNTNEKEKEALGNFARRFICENYSVDIMVQTQLDGYRKILAQRTDYDILICGYYGYGNMGDETLLSVMAKELRRLNPALRLCALSGDPQKTKSLHQVDTIDRFDPDQIDKAMKRSKILLFGGGNLLQNKTSTHSLLYYTHILRMAKKRGLKIFIYANGIGPLHGEENRKRTIEAFRLADSISLRDPHSFAFVRNLHLNKPLRLTFDPAILTEKEDFPIPQGNYFAVVPKQSSLAFTQAISNMIRSISQKTGLAPILVSLYDRQDMPSVKKIASQTHAQIYSPKNAGECVTLFSSAKLVVSSRLHALIYATAAVCPMMGYSDDKKLFSYLDYIGFGACSILPCGLSAIENAESAANRALTILNQSDYCKNRISEHLPSWKSLARNEIEEILRLAENDSAKKT